ncbi:hypothetical protein ACFL27_15065 [candidate division CSSED10-310 bacterium]|uniref:Zinc ribbon domain-containing protein n=1 Tax=candidate division CSSED10-310 bacterium TaxID=2855610 RepID=A0ABV6YZ93_UNCC1
MKITCKRCNGSFSSDVQGTKDQELCCPYCDTPVSENRTEKSETLSQPDFAAGADTLELTSAPPLTQQEVQSQKEEEPDQFSGQTAEFVSDEYRTSPLGVRLIAATFGILGIMMALFIMFQIINDRFTSPVLTPAYIAIGISVFIALLMYFLYQYSELARKITILLCIISMLNSGRTLVQILQLASTVPWRELINYSLRFIFSLYFMLYLMTPNVKAAFVKRKTSHE